MKTGVCERQRKWKLQIAKGMRKLEERERWRKEEENEYERRDEYLQGHIKVSAEHV